MSSPKILVIGSTGTIGFQVSQALAKRKVSFRATVHDLSKVDKIKNLGSNIEVAQVDVWKPETFAPALQGIEQVFLMSPPGQTNSSFGIVDVIKNSSTKHIVLLSALGCDETGGKFIMAEHHREVEEYITKKGIPLTSLRPSLFFTNLLRDAASIKSQSPIYKYLGNAKANWVSTEDIGEVAAIALTEGGHEGKIYNLTGPDIFDWDDLIKLLNDTLGKQLKHLPLTEEQFREIMSKYMPSQEAVSNYVNMLVYLEKGGCNRKYPDIENLLGRKPKSMKDFIAENKQAFQ